MSKVAIIDYGSGNLRSAYKAFVQIAGAHEVSLVTQADALAAATHIVLPGVGAFQDCLRGLSALPDMRAGLEREVIENAKPFLGICVGMQLMASYGYEHGKAAGFDWLAAEIHPLEISSDYKIPHMGWNNLILEKPHPVLEGLEGENVYFVHSYHAQLAESAHLLASVDYGGALTAAMGRDNLFGTQFHPEKSQAAGLRLLENFVRWRP